MNKVVPIVIAAVGGTGLGAAVGYTVAMRRANKKISEMLDELDVAYKDALARATKTGPYSTVMGAAEVILGDSVLRNPVSDIQVQAEKELAEEALPTPDGAGNLEPEEGDESDQPIPVRQETDEEVSRANTADFLERFKNRGSEERGGITLNGEEVNPEVDTPISSVPNFVTVRDPNAPYVISIDDYMTDEEAFDKQEMTYFEGDEVLIDSRESIAGSLKEDRGGIDRIIGVHNLDRWGSGTTDPDQFYIRNERLGVDIEVTRDKGTYTRTVLGVKAEDEIARSMQKPLKMREGDDH